MDSQEKKSMIDISSYQSNTDRLQNAMEKLCPDCQKVLRLYYYEDWCIEAIEKEMGYKPGFGRVRLYRCREKLKKLLQS